MPRFLLAATLAGLAAGFQAFPAPPLRRASVARRVGEAGIGGRAGDDSPWAREYKAYVKRVGFELCGLSWEGFVEKGRGAVFSGRSDKSSGDDDRLPSAYVELEQWTKSQAEDGKDGDGLGAILRRIRAYDPNKEFVVVYQAFGVMGADVVRPSMSPPEVGTLLKQQAMAAEQKEFGTTEEDDRAPDENPDISDAELV